MIEKLRSILGVCRADFLRGLTDLRVIRRRLRDRAGCRLFAHREDEDDDAKNASAAVNREPQGWRDYRDAERCFGIAADEWKRAKRTTYSVCANCGRLRPMIERGPSVIRTTRATSAWTARRIDESPSLLRSRRQRPTQNR